MTRTAVIQQFIRVAPRPLVVLAAELSGFSSVRNEGSAIPGRGRLRGLGGFSARVHSLLSRSRQALPHPLFSAAYYLDHYPDVKKSLWPPLLHFLLWGGFEGRNPHPLFDSEWYLVQNPDVAASKLSPLQHYVRFGHAEGRDPHPLFHAAEYLQMYPDVQKAGYDPAVHFLLWGGAQGRQPHPLFDCGWYIRRYPEVLSSGLNPLLHYLLEGGVRGLEPNSRFDTLRYVRHYPAAARDGMVPLLHFVSRAERGAYDPHPGYPRPAREKISAAPSHSAGALKLGDSPATATAPQWRNPAVEGELPVFVVYGASNVAFLEATLIPALAAQQSDLKFHLHTLHYRSSQSLLSPSLEMTSGGNLAGITDWSSARHDRHIGFGEAVNYLFEKVAPKSCFYLVNPDSVPMKGCMETLLSAFRGRNAAIVEARQWPCQHPKEFDPSTGETPWASGAFLFLSAVAFRRLGGFDPIYFLYNEDVDLSWRAWLAGMPVIYEPGAMCAHFTGALSYNPTRYYYENFFGLRNFLVIAYKFFGEEGERTASTWIQQASLPAAFKTEVQNSYLGLRGRVQRVDTISAYHRDKIKILGLNQYHNLRRF
jgi:hypothetical protein